MAPPLKPPAAASSPRTGNPAEDRARAQQSADLGPIVGAPLLKARLYPERIVLTSGMPKTIAHGLGRKPMGWLLADFTAAAPYKRNQLDERLIVLEASGDVEAALWLW